MARKYRVRLLLGVPGKGGQFLWKDVQADDKDGAVAAVNDWFEKQGSYPEGTSCDIEAVMPWPEPGHRGWLLDEGKDGQADFEKFCDRVYIKLCDSGLDPETAGALLDKYGATIVKDSFTNGRNAAETAAAVNSAHNDESKSESKKKEGFRLELVDTITVPMWLYDAYVMGKEYGGNLTFTEQEKLADFREKYGSYHLDNHDEEAQYHGTNEFDGMGGLCYDVDVYKRSSDESKKNESKNEASRQDFDIDCESCLQALDEMKKKVLEWKEQGFDGVDDPKEVSLLCRALRDVESKFEIR